MGCQGVNLVFLVRRGPLGRSGKCFEGCSGGCSGKLGAQGSAQLQPSGCSARCSLGPRVLTVGGRKHEENPQKHPGYRAPSTGPEHFLEETLISQTALQSRALSRMSPSLTTHTPLIKGVAFHPLN